MKSPHAADRPSLNLVQYRKHLGFCFWRKIRFGIDLHIASKIQLFHFRGLWEVLGYASLKAKSENERLPVRKL